VAVILLALILIVIIVLWRKREARNYGRNKTESVGNIIMDPAASDPAMFEHTHTGQTTMLNTRYEIALPGYLLLDYTQNLRIEDKLASGGGGVIYVGTLLGSKSNQVPADGKIVVKHVPNREDFSNLENQRNFEQEISTMSALAFNENIVPILGYCIMPRCIVMPLLNGDLFRLLQDQYVVLSDWNKFSIIQDTCSALNACHSIGVVHRDLKTPNLLVKNVPEPKRFQIMLCDFGVCRVRETGQVKGRVFLNVFGLSYKYAAPEVFSRAMLNSTGGVDFDEEAKSDVYAFAICVWEVLTRQTPWNKLNREEIQQMVSEGQRPPLPEPNTAFERLISELTMMCWAQNLQERPRFADIMKKLNSLALDPAFLPLPNARPPAPKGTLPKSPSSNRLNASNGITETSTSTGGGSQRVTNEKESSETLGRSPVPALPPKNYQPATLPNPKPKAAPRVPTPVMAKTEVKRKEFKVIYDYRAVRDDELTIQSGDIVELVKRQPDGWMLVVHQKTGQQGLIPSNYVSEMIL